MSLHDHLVVRNIQKEPISLSINYHIYGQLIRGKGPMRLYSLDQVNLDVHIADHIMEMIIPFYISNIFLKCLLEEEKIMVKI